MRFKGKFEGVGDGGGGTGVECGGPKHCYKTCVPQVKIKLTLANFFF